VWAAFAWGALGAYGFASLTNDLVMRTTISALITRYFDDLQNGAPGQAILAVVTIRSIRLMAWHAGIVEELAKAVGVALLLLFGGRRVRTVVSGIVLGGIAGLGFNFSESVRYISSQYTSTASWDAGGFEYWMRQSVGLLGAHTAFSAVAGAGLAVAAGSADPRRRARAASAGLLAAIGSHVANDTLPGWFSQVTGGLGVTVSGTWDTLVLSPLLILVIQVPMVVVYVLLLRGGLREQAAGFARAVAEEAVCGAGAITPGEAAVLAHPAARLWAVAGTARRYGLAAALALRRVHSAQLQLACWRWQHCGQATDGATAGGAGADSATGGAAVPGTLRLHRLRQRVVHLKEHGLGPALEAAA
jgi:RsiW-degrading membrane proteinase PrsW (M82 family)